MKKVLFFILAAFLLCACGNGQNENESSAEEISADRNEEYMSTAHERLENDTDISLDTDISAESEPISAEESPGLASEEESSESVSREESSESVSETGSEADMSEVKTEEPSDESEEESVAEESTGNTEETVLLVTADIAYEDGTSATLVCGADGTADLYFGNGSSLTDMERYGDCLENAMYLIKLCQFCLDEAEPVAEYTFPETGNTYIYIKTDNNIYRIAYDNTLQYSNHIEELENCVGGTVISIAEKAEQ